ncbi:MAG: apolipoprotein N-acyltransferase [Ignavibacteriae bacterium]|nr:apolipoprotein N-acyltransferase [Ignavibacteriota bacterium]
MNIPDFLKNKTILCITAGIFFGLSFPPVNLYFLVFVAFAIYIYIVTTATTYRQVILRTYLIFVIWEMIAISWIGLSGFTKPEYFMIIGGFMTALLHPIVYLLPPTIIFFFVARNMKFKKNQELILIFLPPIWIAFEYLQTTNELTFPWLSLAYTQTYNLHKVQYIDITGMYTVTLWITIIAILLFFGARKLFSREWQLKGGKIIILGIIIIIIYFIPDFYAFITSPSEKYTKNFEDGKIDVGIVQPNKNPWFKWGSDQFEITKEYVKLMEEAADHKPRPKLIILPETSLPYVLRMPMNETKHAIIKTFVQEQGIPVLIGTPDILYYPDTGYVPPDAREFSDGRKYDIFNTAILVEKNVKKENYQTHDKFKLVIGSERMPYQNRLLFLRDLIKWSVGLSNFQIGKDTVLFDLDGKYKFNTAICYESVFPEFFAHYVDMGAEFSVIITNDGWWGKLFGTYQHNQYATFRAIENRRWIARSANTGISCTIDPYGNMYDVSNVNEQAIINSEIGIRKEKTFYTTHGDVFSKIMILVSIATLIIAIGLKFRKRTTS